MSRCIVNVSTDSWVQGQFRLCQEMQRFGERPWIWMNRFPTGCPPHRTHGMLAGLADQCRPYAFKAYALKEAMDAGASTLLWCDASIIPVRNLKPLWERIERDGYWIVRNGWSNSDWTADEAYPDLFPECFGKSANGPIPVVGIDGARDLNRGIPHVVGTAFGIDTSQAHGRVFLHEYFRLASQTRAFCGPWQNSRAPSVEGRNSDRTIAECGPATTLGHRHDQTAMSVIAWRLKMRLDESRTFTYAGGETDETILVAKGL